MRVDVVRPLSAITWSCVAHTRNDEWTASTVRFGIADRGPQACELDFRHTGIGRELVAEGWEHFLVSLAAYAERGAGSPHLTGRPGQTRAGRRQTHRSSTHAGRLQLIFPSQSGT
jgi:hypothetical protein